MNTVAKFGAALREHLNDQPQETVMPEPAVNPKSLRAAADGKVPLEYLESALETPLAHVMKHGADKYGRRNYRDTPCKISTYVGAIRRHTLAWQQGEDIDPDSGQPHLAHIAACCAVMLGAEEAGTRVDDRHEAVSTPLSDRVHIDGDQSAKGLTAEYNRGADELVEELHADSCRLLGKPVAPPSPWGNDVTCGKTDLGGMDLLAGDTGGDDLGTKYVNGRVCCIGGPITESCLVGKSCNSRSSACVFGNGPVQV